MRPAVWLDLILGLLAGLSLWWWMDWQVFVGIGGVVLVLLTLLLSQRKLAATSGRVMTGEVAWPKAATLKFWKIQWLVVLSLLIVTSVSASHFSLREFFDEKGLSGAGRIFSSLLSPRWSLLPEAFNKLMETLLMSFFATLLATPVAFVLSFFAARNLMKKNWRWLYISLRILMNFVRSVEVLIWAIVFSVWVGIGPFAGVLALSVHTLVSLMKQFSEIIEGAATGPIDAVRSTGANSAQVILFGVVPQVSLPFLSFVAYRWDLNLRMATIVGLVGGGGIGTLIVQLNGQGAWHELGTVFLLVGLFVWILDTFSALVREALS